MRELQRKSDIQNPGNSKINCLALNNLQIFRFS